MQADDDLARAFNHMGVGHQQAVGRDEEARPGGAKLRLAVTLAAPYAGSVHARCFPGTSLSQLRPGNAWLEALAAEPLPTTTEIVSIWSWHDSMVAPQLSSRLEGARNVELVGIGHNALLIDADVARLVVAELLGPR